MGASFRPYDLISRKRDGGELTTDEIRWLVSEFAADRIPDYQMAAWLMAVCIRGMSDRETADLTQAMVDSGEKLDLSGIPGVKVDKHSTGGVGDKTTLVLVPLLAAAGLRVAKMSGRGLGHTGGTIDKLESIPGFCTDLSPEGIVRLVKDVGAVMASQSDRLVLADRKMYALRDVTATVGSIPLIASSVMSKKLACGADVILLDVKYGSGAFVATADDARRLARAMIAIGRAAGKKVIAAVTSMNDVMGNAVGNSLEVAEAIETLHGGGPADLRELCLQLGAAALVEVGQSPNGASAEECLERLLDDGSAAAKLAEIIRAQGGDDGVVSDPSLLGAAEVRVSVASQSTGYVTGVDVKRIGQAAGDLGAGRFRIEDDIDPQAGIVVRRKLGDRVREGDALAELHTNHPRREPGAIADDVRSAYPIAAEYGSRPQLVDEILLPD